MTPVYKAVHRLRLSADDQAHLSRNIQNATIRIILDDTLERIRDEACWNVSTWLDENHYSGDVIHRVWTRLSDDCREIITTWTFGDPDAALLFKLSLN